MQTTRKLFKILVGLHVVAFTIASYLVTAAAVAVITSPDASLQSKQFWIGTTLACLGVLVAIGFAVISIWKPERSAPNDQAVPVHYHG